jgi:hypothetical protein
VIVAGGSTAAPARCDGCRRAGDHDAVGRVDDLAALGLQVEADRRDLGALDEHVAAREVADVGVDRHDVPVADQKPV